MAHDGAVGNTQAQQHREQRTGCGEIKTVTIGHERFQMAEQQIEQQAEQGNAKAKAQLAVDIP
ncbi:hypothetical protein D3C80_1479690 [compost metagenome]